MHRISLIAAFFCWFAFGSAQSWKSYPYHEEGTLIHFPQDEGRHPAEPTEWWYTNAFLTGLNTGKDYSVMLSYFYYPVFGFDGFRIFNLADEYTGQFFTEALPCTYPVMSQDHLNIQAQVYSGGNEQWITQEDNQGNLIPFEYQLNAQSQNGSINLTYTALKKPLMINDSGFVYQGAEGYSYYYSMTSLGVEGTISLNGITEPVTGNAWIDRQFGTFNPSIGEQYEWFSIQLSNGMDLNIWELFTPQSSIPDTSTYRHFSMYINDSASYSNAAFSLERLNFIFMPDQEKCYSRQWRFAHDSIDLTFNTLHNNQEVLLPFRFYEGSLSVTGMVGTEAVTGVGFAELVHSYYHPEIELNEFKKGMAKNGFYTINWQLLNPDDARPIYYDVEISLNDSLNYEPVAQFLSGLSYNWDNSAIVPGTPFWIRVYGYSIDTTLHGMVSTGVPLITGVDRIIPHESGIYIYPNPVKDHIHIVTDKDLSGAEFSLLNNQGQVVLSEGNLSEKKVSIAERKFNAGVYFYKIAQQEKVVAAGKLLLE